MEEINPQEVAKKYNSIDTIWREDDTWHYHTRQWIQKFINRSIKIIPDIDRSSVLNAGSGGETYEIPCSVMMHVDIAEKRLENTEHKIISNIEQIPVKDKSYDTIICVGSVINYCDPENVLLEFERIVKPNGYLILEFENSFTFELLFSGNFNKRRAFIKTFYLDKEESIWYYSEKFIKMKLQRHNFKIISISRCHLFSPLILKYSKNERLASKFSFLDKFLSYIPFIKRFSSNVIVLTQRL